MANKLIEVQPHSSEQLLDELVTLAGDTRSLRDVRPNLGLHDTETVLRFLPLFYLGQVELEEVPQLVGHDPCTVHTPLKIQSGRGVMGSETSYEQGFRAGGGERARYLRRWRYIG